LPIFIRNLASVLFRDIDVLCMSLRCCLFTYIFYAIYRSTNCLCDEYPELMRIWELLPKKH